MPSNSRFLLQQITILFSLIFYTPLDYPGWARALGWLIAAFPMSLIIAVFVYRLFRTGGCGVSSAPYRLFRTSGYGVITELYRLFRTGEFGVSSAPYRLFRTGGCGVSCLKLIIIF